MRGRGNPHSRKLRGRPPGGSQRGRGGTPDWSARGGVCAYPGRCRRLGLAAGRRPARDGVTLRTRLPKSQAISCRSREGGPGLLGIAAGRRRTAL
jgi:hypothetical protein